jgi:hypothetical protein
MPRKPINDRDRTCADRLRVEAARPSHAREAAAGQLRFFKAYPPEGEQRRWWDRLKAALGTTSSDFVNATLVQIQNASRMPSGGISETSVNAVLAFIEAAEPKNEMEAALAIQMACTHAVAMAVLSRAGGAYGGDRHVSLMASASARLLNAFANQVETLRRLRNGGTQVIRVERIEVSDTAQAVIGNISSRDLK